MVRPALVLMETIRKMDYQESEETILLVSVGNRVELIA